MTEVGSSQVGRQQDKSLGGTCHSKGLFDTKWWMQLTDFEESLLI